MAQKSRVAAIAIVAKPNMLFSGFFFVLIVINPNSKILINIRLLSHPSA
jgi:hypothetical protein